MRRTRWTSAVTWFMAAAVTSWVVGDLLLRHVGWVPVLSPWGAVTAPVIAGIVLVAGLAVRRLRASARPSNSCRILPRFGGAGLSACWSLLARRFSKFLFRRCFDSLSMSLCRIRPRRASGLAAD